MKLPSLIDVDDWEWSDWRDFYQKVKDAEGDECAWLCVKRLYDKSFEHGKAAVKSGEKDGTPLR